MNSNGLFFNILYCSGSRPGAQIAYSGKILKPVKHHKLVFVTEGKGKASIGEKKYHFKKGTLLYISPDSREEIEIYAEEPIAYLSVLFDYVTVVLDDGKYSVDDERAVTIPLQTVYDLIDFYPVNTLFEQLVHTWDAKLPGYEFISKTIFQELIITVLRNRSNHGSNYAASLKVEKVIQYMREHIDRRINLAELAETVQISSFHLSKIFREITGYSVIEYFNKIKIDQAKAMLIEGDKKIKEVARALGFSDEFYFSRVFRKIEGISPSEYHNRNVHGF